MVCNDLVMPLILRWRGRGRGRVEGTDIPALLLGIRRWAIVAILMLGYFYFRIAGEAYALVSIGLISFAAVAQFAPAAIGGMYWKGGSRSGALSGLLAGFAVWLYTLVLPAFARSGWVDPAVLESGPFGIRLLRPGELFGLDGLDPITHAMVWSMTFNVGAYVLVSLFGRRTPAEHGQAALFVDIFSHTGERARTWRGATSPAALQDLLARFLGPARAAQLFHSYAKARGHRSVDALQADAELVHFVEIELAATFGAASAHAMVATVAQAEPLRLDEVMSIIDEASHVMAYSRRLEEKQHELERATAGLKAANARLQELDRMKDDFVSTVTHELRTPLTSIRALSEILHDHPDIAPDERHRFLGLIISESERLTRLINQVLDLAKLESGHAVWKAAELDLAAIVEDAVGATSQLFKNHEVELRSRADPDVPPVLADRDRVMQVMLNLLSNAVKFCPPRGGRVEVRVLREADGVRVDVQDNGVGIDPGHQSVIFEKFRQVGDTLTEKPAGTGLGLAICRQIIDHFGGHLWVESGPGSGSVFSFFLPAARSPSVAGGRLAAAGSP
jgi:signal transduction histidine kinase